MYQIKGGRLFQITAAGIDAAQTGSIPGAIDSAVWTGRYDLSSQQRAELKQLLQEMRSVVSSAKLSNARTANAMALIDAAELLVDTPDPLWPEIMRLLRSPTLAGVVGIAGLLLSVVQILMAAAGN
ncbi:hypothetical protein [Aureimonas endophytica]|nr:hypothetical protein [Aureimonas endophytica]